MDARKILGLVVIVVVFFNVHGSRIHRLSPEVIAQYDRIRRETHELHTKIRPDDVIRPEHILRASRDLETAWRFALGANTHQKQLQYLSDVRGFYEIARAVYDAQNARRSRL